MSSQFAVTIAGPAPEERTLHVGFADTPAQVREAQRLRHQVFAGELGAKLHSPVPGLDIDSFDEHCRHLLVCDGPEVVGYTRILTAEDAHRAGGFYSETEFDLSRMLAMPGRFAEIGRTCVHPDYRTGATITTLWTGVADFISRFSIDYLIGCASVALGEEGAEARAIFASLAPRYLIVEHLRAQPKVALSEGPIQDDFTLPPLLKAYLRLGAKVGGEPCVDPDFNVADLLVLLSTRRLERRYARHFLERAL